jgi:hypothetical protein
MKTCAITTKTTSLYYNLADFSSISNLFQTKFDVYCLQHIGYQLVKQRTFLFFERGRNTALNEAHISYSKLWSFSPVQL